MKSILFLVVVLFLLSACVANKSIVPKESAAEAGAIEAPAPAPMVLRAPPKPTTSATLGRGVIGEGSSSMNVYTHSYRVLKSLDEVKSLKNTVTYVLLPDNLSKDNNKEAKEYRRYAKLLGLIQQLRKTDLSTPADSVAAKSDNQFILFSTSKKEEQVTVKNYDYQLSNRVLNLFKELYSYSLFSKEGPYLVTVTKDIWNRPNNLTFLYVNLTNFNDSALKEIVEKYKERLINKGDSEITMFEKFHASLLSFLTNLNDDIRIFQSAVAGDI